MSDDTPEPLPAPEFPIEMDWLMTQVGGYVFPQQQKLGNGMTYSAAGLAVLDYFAAQAMAALITARVGGALHANETAIAEDAYLVAEAMNRRRTEIYLRDAAALKARRRAAGEET